MPKVGPQFNHLKLARKQAGHRNASQGPTSAAMTGGGDASRSLPQPLDTGQMNLAGGLDIASTSDGGLQLPIDELGSSFKPPWIKKKLKKDDAPPVPLLDAHGQPIVGYFVYSNEGLRSADGALHVESCEPLESLHDDSLLIEGTLMYTNVNRFAYLYYLIPELTVPIILLFLLLFLQPLIFGLMKRYSLENQRQLLSLLDVYLLKSLALVTLEATQPFVSIIFPSVRISPLKRRSGWITNSPSFVNILSQIRCAVMSFLDWLVTYTWRISIEFFLI